MRDEARKLQNEINLKRLQEAIRAVERPCDCVSLRRNDSCHGLLGRCEQTQSCRFYKNEADDKLSKIKWAKRLSSLSEAKQNRISRKYYSGARPWEGWVK